MPKKPKIPVDVLRAEYEAGKTLRQLADAYGRSFQAIHSQLVTAGVTMRPTRERKHYPRPCAACGELFTPRKKNQRYCSFTHGHPPGAIRKAVCANGHPQIPENRMPTYRGLHRGGSRCKPCFKEIAERSRQKRMQKLAQSPPEE